ncbi:MAG: endonuclease/exonuclease/phosphatase family protein [Anaerolineae bacterium]|nr:endonuclease/exonuclease/phosphatase family protein [Anaerolineae bacterium]
MDDKAAQSKQPLSYRLMTYNIGGGRKQYTSETSLILQVVRTVSPDIVVIQEAARFLDVEGRWHSDLDEVFDALGGDARHVFTPTLSMREHMHPRNKTMANAVFDDHQDWQQGNAIVSRWPFHRPGNPGRPGAPLSVPLRRSPVYEGSRDTEPRAALLARIGRAPQFPIVVGVHLSTLVGERGKDIIPGKPEQAAGLREEETQLLLDLLRSRVLDQNEVVFLLGDFNATINEPSIKHLLDVAGFMLATPMNGIVSTHSEVKDAIDHIFLFPSGRVVEYQSFVVDTEAAHRASDHLPVVTDVVVC